MVSVSIVKPALSYAYASLLLLLLGSCHGSCCGIPAGLHVGLLLFSPANRLGLFFSRLLSCCILRATEHAS